MTLRIKVRMGDARPEASVVDLEAQPQEVS